jgi:predicted TIM-barrel fold metal-dependent hydrolase
MAVQFAADLIVDSHHHIGRKEGTDGTSTFSGADLIARMDENGVRATVAMHFVSALRTAADFRAANDYVAAEVAQHPDRLAGAVCVHPLLPGADTEELRRGAEMGFRAVKLHPVFHGAYALDRRVEPVIRLAGELGLPVVIHSDFAQPICSPYAIADLAARCPETTIVLLHMGLQPGTCSWTPEIVEPYANVVVDTSQTPDAPGSAYGRPVRLLGADRVVFGSDGPEYEASVNLCKLEAAVARGYITREEAEAVVGRTACDVFGLELPHVDEVPVA